MEFKIVSSSPKAKELTSNVKQSTKYPFDSLEVGQSFTAVKSEINWKSLRVCMYEKNKRDASKEFAFIMHDDMNIVEVARIA